MALSLTATPDTVDGSVDLVVAGAAGDQTNLVTNPSLEVDASGWNASGTGTTVARSTAQADTGSASLAVITGTTTSSGANVVVTGLTPGWTIGARLRVLPSVLSDFKVTLQWRTSGSAVVSSTALDYLGCAAGAWQTLHHTGVVPATADRVWIYVQRINSSTSGVSFYLDAALARRVRSWETWDPADYFEGTRLGVVTITRDDDNAAGRAVRLGLAQVPVAGALAVTDHEAALTGPLSYTATDSTGATATDSTALDLTEAAARLHDVQLPTGRAVTPDQLTGYEAAAGVDSVVHWPVNRATPVVVTGATRRTRQGRLTAWCATHAEAVALLAVAVPGRPLMLRQGDHPGLDMYFQALEATTRPEELLDGGWCWAVEVDYVETAYPPGAVLE